MQFETGRRFPGDHPMGFCCRPADNNFDRLQSRINGCDRNYHRALKELQRLRAQSKPAAGPHQIETPREPQKADHEAPIPEGESR